MATLPDCLAAEILRLACAPAAARSEFEDELDTLVRIAGLRRTPGSSRVTSLSGARGVCRAWEAVVTAQAQHMAWSSQQPQPPPRIADARARSMGCMRTLTCDVHHQAGAGGWHEPLERLAELGTALPTLREVTLHPRGTTNEVLGLAALRQLTQLTQLSVRDSARALRCDVLPSAACLRVLLLQGVQLSAARLPPLPSLTCLEASSCSNVDGLLKDSWHHVRTLGSIAPQLQHLSINGCDLRVGAVERLLTVPGLTRLDAASSRLHPSAVAAIAEHLAPTLQHLDLSKSQVSVYRLPLTMFDWPPPSPTWARATELPGLLAALDAAGSLLSLRVPFTWLPQYATVLQLPEGAQLYGRLHSLSCTPMLESEREEDYSAHLPDEPVDLGALCAKLRGLHELSITTIVSDLAPLTALSALTSLAATVQPRNNVAPLGRCTQLLRLSLRLVGVEKLPPSRLLAQYDALGALQALRSLAFCVDHGGDWQYPHSSAGLPQAFLHHLTHLRCIVWCDRHCSRATKLRELHSLPASTLDGLSGNVILSD
jgi:hypothetical protein